MSKKYSMSKFIFLFTSLLLVASLNAQTERIIAFYNVENLFDTVNDTTINDEEFLPTGAKEWTKERYNEKIKHINQVIDSVGVPLIFGMCEIENKGVVQDIVDFGSMKNTHAVVHYQSLDFRGIDNAIIYDKTVLTLVKSGIIRFDMPAPDSPSRDIVWAKFSHGKDTILAMVNHWPSRSGGQVESEPKRLIASIAASTFIDSVLAANKKMKIVFMGDLNDTPEDRSASLIAESLKPLITPNSGQFGGSHNYNGEWSILDHIMVSKAFLKKGAKVNKKSGTIYSPDFLLSEYKGNIVPNRTYGGSKYLGGYSDHLPVMIRVKI